MEITPPEEVVEALRVLVGESPERLEDLWCAAASTRLALAVLAPELGRRRLEATGVLTVHADLIKTIDRHLSLHAGEEVLFLDQIELGEVGGVVSRGMGLLNCAGDGEERPWGRQEERRVGEELDRIISALGGAQLVAVLLPAWVIDEAPGCRLTRQSLARDRSLHAVIELPDRTGKPGGWALIVVGRDRRTEGIGGEILFLRPFAAHDPREGGDPGGAQGWHCWRASVGDVRDKGSWRPELAPRLKALEEVELLARAEGNERVSVREARALLEVVPPRVDEDYLENYLRQPPLRNAVQRGWSLEDLPVPLPPMEAQRELAVALEQAEAPAGQILPALEGRDWRDGQPRPRTGTLNRLMASMGRAVGSISDQMPPRLGNLLRRVAKLESNQEVPTGGLSERLAQGVTVFYDVSALESEAEQDAKHASDLGQRVARLTAAADEIHTLTKKGLIVKAAGQVVRAGLLRKRNQAMGPVELVFGTRAVVHRTVNGQILLNLRNKGRTDIYHVAIHWGLDGPADGDENQRYLDVIPPGKTHVIHIPLAAGEAREARLNLRWSARNLLGAEVKGKISLPLDIGELDDSPDPDDLLGTILGERDWVALEREVRQGEGSSLERLFASALLCVRRGDRGEAERALFEAARISKDADEIEMVSFFAQVLALPETGLAILEDAWERFPDEGDVALALGRARHWAGQDHRAVAPLARAIEQVNSEALALLALVGDDQSDARLLLEKADRDEVFNLMLLPWHLRQRDMEATAKALREVSRARRLSGPQIVATAFDLLVDREADTAARLADAYTWESDARPLRELLAAHIAHHQGETKRRDTILARFFGSDHRFRIDAADVAPPDVSNPYNLSKPITSDGAFFGRADELTRLRRTVSDPSSLGLALLEGARRTGKTSLLNKVGRDLPGDILRVQINLQEMGKPSVTRLWSWMGRQIIHASSPAAKRPLSQLPETFEAFAEFVDELIASGRWRGIALLIDEFECLDDALRTGELPTEVLGQLRALLQSRAVGAVIAGAHALTERRLDYWSPLFGFATRVDLGPLDELSAAELVERPSVASFPWSRDAVSYALDLSGRHPFYLRHLCAEVFEARRQRWRRRPVTRSEVNDAIPAALHAAEEHLREQYRSAPDAEGQCVLRRLAAEPVLDTSGLDRGELKMLASDEVLQSLERRGYLVAGDHTGTLRIAVGLLHQWIATNQPWEAEVQG